VHHKNFSKISALRLICFDVGLFAPRRVPNKHRFWELQLRRSFFPGYRYLLAQL